MPVTRTSSECRRGRQSISDGGFGLSPAARRWQSVTGVHSHVNVTRRARRPRSSWTATDGHGDRAAAAAAVDSECPPESRVRPPPPGRGTAPGGWVTVSCSHRALRPQADSESRPRRSVSRCRAGGLRVADGPVKRRRRQPTPSRRTMTR